MHCNWINPINIRLANKLCGQFLTAATATHNKSDGIHFAYLCVQRKKKNIWYDWKIAVDIQPMPRLFGSWMHVMWYVWSKNSPIIHYYSMVIAVCFTSCMSFTFAAIPMCRQAVNFKWSFFLFCKIDKFRWWLAAAFESYFRIKLYTYVVTKY